MRERLNKLCAQLKDTQNIVKHNDEEIRRLKEEKNEINQALSSAESSIKEISSKNEELSLKTVEFSKKITDLTQRMKELESAAREKEGEISTLAASLSEAKKKLEEKEADLSHKNLRVKESAELIEELKKRVELSEKEKSTYVREIEKVNELCENFRNNLDNLEKDRDSYENKKILLKKQNDDLTSDNKDLILKLKQLNEQLINTQSQLDLKVEEVEKLNKELSSNYRNDNEIINDLKGQIDYLREELNGALSENKELEKDAEIIRDEKNKRIKELESDVKTLTSQSNELKELNINKDKIIFNLREENKKLKESTVELNKKLSNLNLDKKRKSRRSGEIIETSKMNNPIYNNYITKENKSYSEIAAKYKIGLNSMLKFLNILNKLFDKREISFEKAIENSVVLNKNLNDVKGEVMRIINSLKKCQADLYNCNKTLVDKSSNLPNNISFNPTTKNSNNQLKKSRTMDKNNFYNIETSENNDRSDLEDNNFDYENTYKNKTIENFYSKNHTIPAKVAHDPKKNATNRRVKNENFGAKLNEELMHSPNDVLNKKSKFKSVSVNEDNPLNTNFNEDFAIEFKPRLVKRGELKLPNFMSKFDNNSSKPKKKIMKNLDVENDFKTGKCWACNIGRNVSLKGCSPYLCKKHKFMENY